MPANNINGAQTTMHGRFHKTITVSTDILGAARACNVCRILVASGTGAIDVYDSQDNTGDHIWGIAASAVGAIYELMCPNTVGLFVHMGAAGIITVTYD